MLPKNLQFQLTADDRKTVFVFPRQLLCLRQTAGTLEFLHQRTNDTFRVIIVRGSNLGVLGRPILAGTVHLLTPGSCEPRNAGVAIQSITDSPCWSLAKEPMPPDPNAVPKHCLQFETGFVRDLLPHAHLDAFAIPRGKEEKLLFQFSGEHSYVLTPRNGDFGRILAALKRSNLDPGMVNKFSAVTDPLPTLPGVARLRFPMKEISTNRRNYAAESAWDVVMDFRQQSLRPGMAMGI